MTTQRTYWHLSEANRKPSEYEVGTSRLLYYPERGFAVTVPLSSWYDRYQRGSALRCSDWERFHDPRETTYTTYTQLQASKQAFVDGILRSADNAYDRALSSDAIALFERVVAPMRYPVHGLQMIAAYVGQMAPAGRIAIASLFQAADEVRRIQTVAYRMRQLQKSREASSDASPSIWEREAAWQPMRELVERLLVTFDWGEALVALNLVVKPAFDHLLGKHLGQLVRARGDDVVARLLSSLDEDGEWHKSWTTALLAVVVADRDENRTVIEAWVRHWKPMAERAVSSLEEFMASHG